jgi:hypothetical protein
MKDLETRIREAAIGHIKNDQLDALEKLNRERTPGPWYSHHCFAGKRTECWCKVIGTTPDPADEAMDGVASAGSIRTADADFIAETANLTGPMIEEIRRLRKENAETRIKAITAPERGKDGEEG